MINKYPQAVTIAGSDCDGSAGMQADMNTFYHYHVYGTSIITACVAGNSYGIYAQQLMPLSFISQEFKDLASDYNICAAKTGMLANATLINTVVYNYKKYNFGPLVVDPVIFTKHGVTLLKKTALDTLKYKLIPLATIITPNFYEAQKLTETKIATKSDMYIAAEKLLKLGAKNVIIKGRHDDPTQKTVDDLVLLGSKKHFWLSGPYYNTRRKNGTGDTLSAGIAAELSKGIPILKAICNAHKYVCCAIKNSLNIAHLYGPINHFV